MTKEYNCKDKSTGSFISKKKIQLTTLLISTLFLSFISCNTVEAQEPICYTKNNNIYYIDFENKENLKEIQLTHQTCDSKNIKDCIPTSGEVSFTKKKRSLFFLDNTDNNFKGELRYKPLDGSGKEGLIDEQVLAYQISEDEEHILYLKGEENGLYLYDVSSKKIKKLCDGAWQYGFSKDGKHFFFENKNVLYVSDYKKEPQKISDHVDHVVQFNEDMSRFIYSKRGCLYLYEGGREEKISDAARVITFYEDGSGYYLTDERNLSWRDLFYDDVPKDPSKNEIRQAFQEELYSWWTVHSLWYFDGKHSKKISDNYFWWKQSINSDIRFSALSSKDRPQLVFREFDIDNFQKLPISKFKSKDAIWDKSVKIQDEFDLHVAFADKVQKVQNSSHHGWILHPSGNSLYFLKNVDKNLHYGDMYRVDLSNREVGKTSLFLKQTSYAYNEFFDDGNYIHYKTKNSQTGDIFLNKKLIEKNVNAFFSEYDSERKTVYYYTNRNSSKQMATLKRYKEGKTDKISDKVSLFHIMDDGKVLYLKNFDNRKNRGDLYLYDGTKSTLLSKNVSSIVMKPNEDEF